MKKLNGGTLLLLNLCLDAILKSFLLKQINNCLKECKLLLVYRGENSLNSIFISSLEKLQNKINKVY